MNTITSGKAKLEDFNILWTSPLIPQDPFVYRSTLCPDLKQKIAQTFLDLDKNPDGQKYLANVDSEKFVVMKDSDYDVIREAGGGNETRIGHSDRVRASQAQPGGWPIGSAACGNGAGS